MTEIGQLATNVKEVQRDPAIKSKWQKYCEVFGNCNRDPSKHPDAFLTAFLESLECYKQNQAEICQIFVGGLPNVPEDQIRQYFGRWGEITKIQIKQGKGFGFVTFTTRKAVDEILMNHNAHEIDGKWVDCKTAENRKHSAMLSNMGPPLLAKSKISSLTQSADNRVDNRAPLMFSKPPLSASNTVAPMAPNQRKPIVQKITSGPLVYNEIFVGGLASSTTQQDIVDYFGHWGSVSCVEFKHRKGFAFVTFLSQQPVNQIMTHHNRHVINGKWADCKIAENRRHGASEQSFPPTNIHGVKKNEGGTMKVIHKNRKFDKGVNTLFVGAIPPNTNGEAMLQTFSPFGIIKHVELKESQGFGFVTFTSPLPIREILAKKSDIKINGKWVDCRLAGDRRITNCAAAGC